MTDKPCVALNQRHVSGEDMMAAVKEVMRAKSEVIVIGGQAGESVRIAALIAKHLKVGDEVVFIVEPPMTVPVEELMSKVVLKGRKHGRSKRINTGAIGHLMSNGIKPLPSSKIQETNYRQFEKRDKRKNFRR